VFGLPEEEIAELASAAQGDKIIARQSADEEDAFF